MTIEEFIAIIEEEYDDIDSGTLKPESIIREDFEWSSVNALIMISLVNVEYDVELSADDLGKAKTIKDLFEIVKKKIS